MNTTPANFIESLQRQPLPCDRESLKLAIRDELVYTIGKDSLHATQRDWLYAASYAVRKRMIEWRMFTARIYNQSDAKRVYYLSMEYLIGRMLVNTIKNMGIYEPCHEALAELGVDLETVAALEPDAALGNGGLGRLAACILDSMASQCLPGYGYGIHYEFGMFQQHIENGQQMEHPDNWLRYGNPWEFPRPEKLFPVRFYGHIVEHHGPGGTCRQYWEGGEEVLAMAYDVPTPGFAKKNVNNLRLWAAKATRDFDLTVFNEGDYLRAVQRKSESETISMVLYPNDATAIGRELRLKQEYLFVSASLQDILDRHIHRFGHRVCDLPDKIAIQLNDTHPALAVAELMRLLTNDYETSWEEAWRVTRAVFNYTNHTLMPEALETWPVELMERVLPLHLQIIYRINHEFLTEVRHTWPGDNEVVQRLSIIDDTGHGRRVRMAHLAVVASGHINGVAALHTELLKKTLFNDFYRLWPDRFLNITNGITPRMWLHQANPELAVWITDRIGGKWVNDLDQLRQLAPLAEDAAARAEFRAIKRNNKVRLTAAIEARTGITLDPDAIFDIQVKRIHEYKRQLLNVLHIVAFYNRLRDGQADDIQPRAFIFAGKAAPAYLRAKQIIRLINDVADIVNHDPAIGGRLKVVFYPNYEVSAAQIIIPAADLSEQISTAGTEASGTGNMKLAVNGAITFGTLDGANIEILEEVGEDNIFIFGMNAEEVAARKAAGYRPREFYENDGELRRVLDMVAGGFFSPDDPGRYRDLVDNLLDIDTFMLLADYRSYVQGQEAVDALYRDPEAWTRKAMLNTALMGKFSIDRTVGEYAERVWSISPECAI